MTLRKVTGHMCARGPSCDFVAVRGCNRLPCVVPLSQRVKGHSALGRKQPMCGRVDCAMIGTLLPPHTSLAFREMTSEGACGKVIFVSVSLIGEGEREGLGG